MAASVVRCSKIAAVKTAELTELMNQTLEDHWNSRKRWVTMALFYSILYFIIHHSLELSLIF